MRVPVPAWFRSTHLSADGQTLHSFSMGGKMSINAISGTMPALPVQAVSGRTNIGVEMQWPGSTSVLTPGDKDLIASIYGPDVLTTGYDKDGKAVGTPAFVSELMADRRSGFLPSGTEVSSNWLNNLNDMYKTTSISSTQRLANPLTPDILDQALKYLAGRAAGGVLDVQA